MSTAAPLYAVRQFAPDEFQMAKFSMPDFNVEAVYNLHRKGFGYTCDCPASLRMVKTKPCKHQRMMPFMMGAVNSDRFYEPESGRWINALPVELTKEGYDAPLTTAATAMNLNDPAKLHNAIAAAVGEPSAAAPAHGPQQARPREVSSSPPSATPLITRRI